MDIAKGMKGSSSAHRSVAMDAVTVFHVPV
jgi:hypothetical protein